MKIKQFLFALLILGGGFAFNVVNAQTMTCTLIPGSITRSPDMVCALYSCPNGEQVQSCNLPEVEVDQ